MLVIYKIKLFIREIEQGVIKGEQVIDELTRDQNGNSIMLIN
jgi:hypothetical protein